MTVARSKQTATVAKIDLDRLDNLIKGYLSTLLEHTEDIKLSDFTRLVELRHRIDQPAEPSNDSLGQINSARTDQLAPTETSSAEGEGSVK
jgi:hypothetical protein